MQVPIQKLCCQSHSLRPVETCGMHISTGRRLKEWSMIEPETHCLHVQAHLHSCHRPTSTGLAPCHPLQMSMSWRSKHNACSPMTHHLTNLWRQLFPHSTSPNPLPCRWPYKHRRPEGKVPFCDLGKLPP